MTCGSFLIKRTDGAKDLPLPKRQTEGASGMDLYSNIDFTIKKGERVLVPTGVQIALPLGYEAQVRPRSGLAFNHGVGMPNSPATIDSDYRGELKVPLINWGGEDVSFKRGDRVAQFVITKVELVDFTETDELPETARGNNGFGSTG